MFNGILAFAVQRFATDRQLPALRKVFYVLQLANVGMLVSFPLQGYAFWSIA